MKHDIYFGKNSIRFWYYRYKDSAYYALSITVLIIVLCSLLVFGYIVPQMDSYLSIRSEVEATLARTAVIKENTAYMNSLNKEQLNTEVKVVTSALPPEKNFGTILDAINASALRSGVTFQDYSFQVGNIASTSAQTSGGTMQGMSTITLTLIINGSVGQLRGFLREVYKTLPLSQITSVDGATGAITVSLEFYQKDLPKVSLKDDQPIPRVIESNAAVLNKIAGWQVLPDSAGTRTAGTTGNIPLF